MKATSWVHTKFDLLSHYHDVAEVGELVRRYFAMNAFDGVLTTVGILAGGYVGGVDSANAMISVIMATAIGMGVSGFYGTYLVERAERERTMRELEESTLTSLDDTAIAAAATYATIVISIVDGLSPFAAATIATIPFFLTSVWSVHTAFYLAAGIAFIELFLLGVFLGRISRERLWLNGVRLMGAGLVALALSLLLGKGVG